MTFLCKLHSGSTQSKFYLKFIYYWYNLLPSGFVQYVSVRLSGCIVKSVVYELADTFE